MPDEIGDGPDGTDECLCPYDITNNGPITDNELYDLYSAWAQDVKALMISDSCHSGSVVKFAPISTLPRRTGSNAPRRKVRFLPPSGFLPKREAAKLDVRLAKRSSSPPGRYAALLLAGCQVTEYSYDAYFQGRPNGAFTFVAVRALVMLPGKSTYADWFRAIRKVLPSQQYPQLPNLFGSSSMKRWRVLW